MGERGGDHFWWPMRINKRDRRVGGVTFLSPSAFFTSRQHLSLSFTLPSSLDCLFVFTPPIPLSPFAFEHLYQLLLPYPFVRPLHYSSMTASLELQSSLASSAVLLPDKFIVQSAVSTGRWSLKYPTPFPPSLIYQTDPGLQERFCHVRSHPLLM